MGRGHREEDEGVEPCGREDRHGYSKPAAAPAAHLPWRRTTDSNRYARALIRLRSDARRLAGSFSMSALPPDASGGRWQRTEQSKPAVLAAARFPAGADHLAGSSSEESG